LDYDGTLAPIVERPEDAAPSKELKEIVADLTSDPCNNVFIISGRDRKILETWMGHARVGLSAEHGCFLRNLAPVGTDNHSVKWHDLLKESGINVDWKEDVIKLFNEIKHKMPGSTIEDKEYAITFHYRNVADKDEHTKQELTDATDALVKKHASTLVFKKGRKSIEARVKGMTKGVVVKKILDMHGRENFGFILCMGDDVTDEDMFIELRDEKLSTPSITCSVSFKSKNSTAYLDKQADVMKLLRALADATKERKN